MAKWKQDKNDENMKSTRRAYSDAVDYISSLENEFNLTGRIALFTHEGYNADLAELNEWDKAQVRP